MPHSPVVCDQKSVLTLVAVDSHYPSFFRSYFPRCCEHVMMWHTAREYTMWQLVRAQWYHWRSYVSWRPGRVIIMGVRSRNYEPKKIESELFIGFPFIWLNFLRAENNFGCHFSARCTLQPGLAAPLALAPVTPQIAMQFVYCYAVRK
jgi:hypothetical protein